MKLNLSLGALAAIQLAAGFAMQIVVLAVLGAGQSTDAYVAAQTVPLLAFGIFATPMQSLWQPRLAVTIDDHAKWKSQLAIAQGQALLVLGSVSLILAATAGLWISVLFPGFNIQQIDLAKSVVRIMFLGTWLNGQAAMLVTGLRARDRFVLPELTAAVAAILGVVAAWLVTREHGVLGAAWVGTCRALLVLVVLLAVAGFPIIRPISALRDAETWRKLRPMLAGASIYKCGPLVDRFWASHAPAGGLTILNLAQAGMAALGQVIERAICIPITPQLARLAESGQFEAMRSTYRRGLIRVTAIALAFLAVLAAVYPVWVSGMHFALKLSDAAAGTMWVICMALIGYLHVVASGSIPVAAFYALGDTKTPVTISVISFIVGIGLRSLGFLWLGLPGLAIATSIYYISNLVAVSVTLEKRLNARIS